MIFKTPIFLTIVAAILALSVEQAAAAPESLAQLVERFSDESGARLVFEARELPPGKYHDILLPLPEERRREAALIACRELKKLPPQYLKKVGLSTIGIFAACASKEGDGFRKFDEELGGYRYYGIYNGVNAIAAAFYTDEQLPLTLHHEIFHHLDRAAAAFAANDPQKDSRSDTFAKILAGQLPYQGIKLKPTDLTLLQKRSSGQILIDTVSDYARKNAAEDMAETARHFMSHLPDSLHQMSLRPQLPGSQRLLHVLDTYARVPDGKGPGTDWFVAHALERRQADAHEFDALAARLLTLQRDLQADVTASDIDSKAAGARQLLDELEQSVARVQVTSQQAASLASAAALRTHDIARTVLQPRDEDRQFTVRGQEDLHGVNWTLRNDINALGQDAARLRRIVSALDSKPSDLLTSQLKTLRLLARYHGFLQNRWRVTQGTNECIEQTRGELIGIVAFCDANLAKQLARPELRRLAEAILADGTIAAGSGVLEANPYLVFVDREIEEEPLRAAIRRVQPACVRLNSASGVNLSADGLVLTAAHVAERLQQEKTAQFPDGTECPAVCIAIDHQLDLALCRLKTVAPLPFAQLSADAPEKGDRVVCIGQPGLISPRTGQPTGYQPFNVSVGQIRGFAADRLGNQMLGGAKHDAWTYWGHSGSPLFNDDGEIVAMHNSWDPKTSMRHAVTHEAIVKFLRGQEVAARLAPPAR